MAISIDYATKIISVPKADLTLVSGTLYQFDTEAFRQELMALQDDEEGIWADTAFLHNTEVTVVGTTFARTITLINGYSIEFEDGQYSVRFAGSNNDFFDVEAGKLQQNQVQIISQNAAGLINPLSQQIVRDAMELASTSGKDPVDDKLDNNFAISAAGL